jgi:hypothetical protein
MISVPPPSSSWRDGFADSRRSVGLTKVGGLAALIFATVTTSIVHPHAIFLLFYYLLAWNAFIYIFHREQFRDFIFAFLISSAFIGLFYLIQTANFPDAYGATSPLSRSWTDDTHFFSLAADDVPGGFPVRPGYYLYFQPFSTLIKIVTLPFTDHPMDVIFFQAGVTALISSFSKTFVRTLGGDEVVARTTFALTLLCPFIMMNGGVILLRDTFVAAMLIYGLACWNQHKYPHAIVAVALQFAIRPGTAIILVPTYALLFFAGSGKRSTKQIFALAALCIGVVGLVLGTNIIDTMATMLSGNMKSISLGGRDNYNDLAVGNMNQILLKLLDLPVILKFPLTGAYIFAYPFFAPANASSPYGFDLRAVTLNILYPLYALWVNGWLIAGVITKAKVLRYQKLIVLCLVATLILIGNYSLQTRHKTMLMPLIYVIAAVGMRKASPDERKIGFAVSFAMIAAEAVVAMR